MSTAPPDVVLPDQLRQHLDAIRPGYADAIKAKVAALAVPCVYATSKRASEHPLRRGTFGRLFGRPTSQPVLGPCDSRFGGVPYGEGATPNDGIGFLGQFDLSEVGRIARHPALRGLLRVDLGDPERSRHPIVGRWFPDASPEKAVEEVVTVVANWETLVSFEPGWSLPRGDVWFRLVPETENDGRLWDKGNDWAPEGFNEDEYCHRLLGWSGLDEDTAGVDFAPVEGGPTNIDDYRLLLRVDADNEAGFHWGTNWLYLLVPEEDLERGDLTRVTATMANV